MASQLAVFLGVVKYLDFANLASYSSRLGMPGQTMSL